MRLTKFNITVCLLEFATWLFFFIVIKKVMEVFIYGKGY